MAFDLWDLLLIIIGIVSFLFVYGWWEDNYFRRRHVKSLPAGVPFVGHMLDVALRKEHVMDMSLRHYNAFPDQKYIGVREFSSNVILVRDLDMIKEVAIKNFDHFEDHEDIFDERSDALIANNLFSLKGQKWRQMRATMSPAFTSSKMKGMYEFIMECGHQMADYFLEEIKKPENKAKGFVETEMKDAFSRTTTDVIATCAFGINVNSLTERDNVFHTMGKEATDFSGIRIFHFMSATAPFMRILGIPVMTKRVTDFFTSLVSDTMKMREEKNIVRPDMIQLLMAAKKGTLQHKEGEVEESKDSGFATVEESSIGKKIEKRKWSDNELASQALAFFIAGFDTTSTLLCFMAHELMVNPDVQKKLQGEIDHVASEAQEKVTYSEILGLKYLDMVVCETLRRWPPVVILDRQCVSSYNLSPPNELSKHSYQMKPKDLLWIPVYGIHHDPQYFKDPFKFDPERFSDENKDEINSFAFMPFGVGPRNCIGSRFALVEAKTIIFFLLQKFDFVVSPKTQIPLELDKSTLFIQAEKGFWIGLKQRNT